MTIALCTHESVIIITFTMSRDSDISLNTSMPIANLITFILMHQGINSINTFSSSHLLVIIITIIIIVTFVRTISLSFHSQPTSLHLITSG